MRHTFMLLATLVLGVAGCVPVALHSFIPPQDGEVDERLMGDCSSEDGKIDWRIEEHPDGYLIQQWPEAAEKTADPAVVYRARTTTLGDHELLDLHLLGVREREGMQWAHLIPGHTLSRIDAAGDTLRLLMLSGQWSVVDTAARQRCSNDATYSGAGT